MRRLALFLLLSAACGPTPALADPLKQQLQALGPATAHDASGRFALQVSLLSVPNKALSSSGRFALRADLHDVQTPLPTSGRYTLDSRLGDAAAGTCNAGPSDAIFANGFEN